MKSMEALIVGSFTAFALFMLISYALSVIDYSEWESSATLIKVGIPAAAGIGMAALMINSTKEPPRGGGYGGRREN